MRTGTEANRREEAPRAPAPRPFELFGEMGLVGICSLVAILTVVGWVAAMAAGVAHLRRHLGGYGDTVGDYVELFGRALRGSWVIGLAGVAVGVLLWANVVWASAGAVPGGGLLVAASLLVGALGWAIVVRAAAAWSSEQGAATAAPLKRWWALVVAAARTCFDDPVGTLLLVVSLAMGVTLVWMFTPLFIVVPGLWVLGAVGVEFRRRTRASRP